MHQNTFLEKSKYEKKSMNKPEKVPNSTAKNLQASNQSNHGPPMNKRSFMEIKNQLHPNKSEKDVDYLQMQFMQQKTDEA